MSILNDENWNKLPQMQKYLIDYRISEILTYLFIYFDKDDFSVYIDEYIESNYPQFAKFFNETSEESIEFIQSSANSDIFAKFFNETSEETNEAMQSNTNDNIFAKYFEDAVKKYAKGDPWKP